MALGAVVLLPGGAVEVEDAVVVDAVGAGPAVAVTAGGAALHRPLVLAQAFNVFEFPGHPLDGNIIQFKLFHPRELWMSEDGRHTFNVRCILATVASNPSILSS